MNVRVRFCEIMHPHPHTQPFLFVYSIDCERKTAGKGVREAFQQFPRRLNMQQCHEEALKSVASTWGAIAEVNPVGKHPQLGHMYGISVA